METTDVSGVVRKVEIDTRRSKQGSLYDVLQLTLTSGDKVEIFSVDRGYLTLMRALGRGSAKQ